MKPILFNTNMVKALLDGRKTVTRRVVKPQPIAEVKELYRKDGTDIWRTYGVDWWYEFRAPFIPGDILWVREAWGTASDLLGSVPGPVYRADYTGNELRELQEKHYRWHPSIHMPRDAARLFLRVTEVRANKLHDVNYFDCLSEGVPYRQMETDIVQDFSALWDSTIKPADRPVYGWAANPWVWIIQFERISRPPEGEEAK